MPNIHNIKITARVVGQGGAGFGTVNAIVNWQISADIPDMVSAQEEGFPIDMNMTDTEISAALRQEVADHITQLANNPNYEFTAIDVRGCSY